MAGAGYKLFNTGDVLTAAQVNTYLQEQTVMVFASSTARTTALSGVLAEGMMSYLQDTNSVEVYNGTSWVNVGNAGDITEVQAGVGISIASGTGPIPVITNSSTDLITTAGDILYGTAADTVARLGIGTAGQVLKVNSGATAPEWGAAGGSDVVLLNTTSFTTVASQQVNSVFSSTYDAYRIYVRFTAISATNTEINLALRIGSDVNATSGNTLTATGATVTGTGVAGRIGLSSTTYPGLTGIICDLNSPNLAARTTGIASGFYLTNVGFETQFSSAFVWNNTTQYTGLTISPASGTMSGEIKIYGFKA